MTENHEMSKALYSIFADRQTRDGFLKKARLHPEIQMGTHPLEVMWEVLNLQRNTLLERFVSESA